MYHYYIDVCVLGHVFHAAGEVGGGCTKAAADPEPRIRRLGPVIGNVRAARLRHPWVPYLRMGHLQRPRSPSLPWIDMSRPRPLPPSPSSAPSPPPRIGARGLPYIDQRGLPLFDVRGLPPSPPPSPPSPSLPTQWAEGGSQCTYTTLYPEGC